MHVHGRIKKTLKGNPNLTYEEQTTSKQRDRDLKTFKKKKKKRSKRGILHERNKETVVENSDQGFWVRVSCTYISLHARASCLRMHTLSMRTHTNLKP